MVNQSRNGAGERAREQSSERADADHEHVECGEAAAQRRVERARLVQMLRAAQCAPQRHVPARCARRRRRVARRHARAAHRVQWQLRPGPIRVQTNTIRRCALALLTEPDAWRGCGRDSGGDKD